MNSGGSIQNCGSAFWIKTRMAWDSMARTWVLETCISCWPVW